jgi:hypothetical protein
MKHTNILQRCALGLALAGASLASQAQSVPNYIIDQFDTNSPGDYSTEVGYYGDAGWGTARASFTFNTNNAKPAVAGAPNNPGSGSMEYMIPWTSTGDQDQAGRTSFNTINVAGDALNGDNYTNLSFDIMFLPDCATDGNGSYGDLITSFYGGCGWWCVNLGVYNSLVSNGTNWIHVNIPIPAGSLSSNAIGGSLTGFGFKVQQNRTGGNLTGTTDFLIDNIILEAPQIPPPPPTLSVSRVTTPPGLLIVQPGPTGGNENGELLLADDSVNGYSEPWLGAGANPVTYSMTITNTPGTNFAGIQSVIELVPGGGTGDTGPAYQFGTAAQLVVQDNADGSATATFGWKTNVPASTPVTVTTLTSASGAVGTWSLTFLNDTNLTVKGPGGLSTNINLPSEDVAQQFAGQVAVYFGSLNYGSTNNAGMGVTYSEFSISGVENTTNASPSSPIDDVFANDAGVLSTDWIAVAPSTPNNAVLIQPTDVYWVGWTLPDDGFSLSSSPTLGAGAVWTSTGLTSYVVTSLQHIVIVPQSSLPATKQGYFALTAPPGTTP